MPEELEVLRQQILDLDNEVMSLLAKRHNTVKQIGEYKARHNLAIFDPKREQQLETYYKTLCKKYNLSNQFIQKLFSIIIEESKKCQEYDK